MTRQSDHPRRFLNKVALVTGGSRGIGFGVAREFAREGADIVLVARSATGLRDAQIRIEQEQDARCHVITADVSDEGAVLRALSETQDVLGGIDVLVNNAGIYPFEPIETLSLERFQQIMAVNVVAPWLCAKHALPYLRERGGGVIINVTSTSGHFGGAETGGTAYDASKAALKQMTATLAAEFGPHQIRVVAIAPNLVLAETPDGKPIAAVKGDLVEAERTPLRRLAYPTDIGRVAAFLASEEAGYITGTSVLLDGGRLGIW